MNLQQYKVIQQSTISSTAIPLNWLQQQDILMPLIYQYAKTLNTDSIATAGSLFLKKLALLTASSSIDYFGFQNKKDDWWSEAYFDLTNFQLLLPYKTFPPLQIDWRHRLLIDFFTPIVKIICKACKIPQKILWENIVIRINRPFRYYATQLPTEKIAQVFHSITECCEEVRPYMSLDEFSGTRQTCCRSYLLPNQTNEKSYCSICPLLT
ncbi:hypothetical protein ACQKL5_08355 [Peribacillus sp. NPDC097675]|uniref:hypothetical protein n=1 Tax=Peribacillus sp. NPDC097675 TaxID=3390618 RepID=UPI003CFFC2F6